MSYLSNGHVDLRSHHPVVNNGHKIHPSPTCNGDTVDHDHRHAADHQHAYLNGTSAINAIAEDSYDDDILPRPRNVGVLDMELYLPPCYVDQEELEQYDNSLKGDLSNKRIGRYTEGLGQWRMGVCSDREDIVSISKTVVDRLMRRGCTGYAQIGRLEVGTETLIDKSKSVKSCLMDLFEASGNFNVDGTDCLNACYGGTQALFNAVNWIESASWDGRYAVVVAADIAVYGEGSARCTGGAGAVALLIGPNAPLVIDQRFKATCAQHVWDFYKPYMASEFPVVDGPTSVVCYLAALDNCYRQFCTLIECDQRRWHKKTHENHHSSPDVTLDSFDHVVFHAPYCKLVQKSVGRLKYLDFYHKNNYRRSKNGCTTHNHQHNNHHATAAKQPHAGEAEMKHLLDLPLTETYTNRTVGKLFEALSADMYEEKTKPSLLLARAVGNMYTASVFACLISLISSSFSAASDVKSGEEKKTVVFSYGSGMIASMYLIRLHTSHPKYADLCRKFSPVALQKRLEGMQRVSPAQFTAMLADREAVLTLPKVVVSKKQQQQQHNTISAVEEKNVAHPTTNDPVVKKLAEMRSFSLSSPPAEQEAKLFGDNMPVSNTTLVAEPSHGAFQTPSPTPLLIMPGNDAANNTEPPAGVHKSGKNADADVQASNSYHYFVPKSRIDMLEPGCFYLEYIDAHMRRFYGQKKSEVD